MVSSAHMASAPLPPDGRPAPDVLDSITIVAVALVAYGLTNVVHEGAGHGGACLLVGGRPQMLNAVFFQCDETGLAPAAIRFIAAAGAILNVVVAAGLMLAGRLLRRSTPAVRYFRWLLVALNLLTAFGYLLFSGIGGFGDWAVVINGLPGELPLRVLEIVTGGVLYFVVAPRVLWRGLVPFLGDDAAERVRRAGRLTVLPYWIGGTLYVAAGLLNPEGIQLVLLSAAAASFGGTSLMAWFFTLRARRSARETGYPSALGIPRSPGWIAAALLTVIVFVGLLGRGVAF